MTRSAARMRRWMLSGAPALGALCLTGHAGGVAAGLWLWALLGILLPVSPAYSGFRRRATPLRLLFACAAGTAVLLAARRFLRILAPETTGAAGARSLLAALLLALPACARAFVLPLRARPLFMLILLSAVIVLLSVCISLPARRAFAPIAGCTPPAFEAICESAWPRPTRARPAAGSTASGLARAPAPLRVPPR